MTQRDNMGQTSQDVAFLQFPTHISYRRDGSKFIHFLELANPWVQNTFSNYMSLGYIKKRMTLVDELLSASSLNSKVYLILFISTPIQFWHYWISTELEEYLRIYPTQTY